MASTIRAQSSSMRVHIPGQWRTDFHYRTEHTLQEILDAGDDYWLPCASMLKPGDQIIHHNAEPAFHPSIDPTDRPGFHNIEKAKQNKTDHQPNPTAGGKCHGHQVTDDLIPDDASVIMHTQIPGGLLT